MPYYNYSLSHPSKHSQPEVADTSYGSPSQDEHVLCLQHSSVVQVVLDNCLVLCIFKSVGFTQKISLQDQHIKFRIWNTKFRISMSSLEFLYTLVLAGEFFGHQIQINWVEKLENGSKNLSSHIFFKIKTLKKTSNQQTFGLTQKIP